MRIIKIGLDSIRCCPVPVAACIGYFDGMHRGHQALIRKTLEYAGKYCCESALITFDPDPWVRVRKDTEIRHITTMQQRIELAAGFGIRNIIILDFTDEMAALTPEEFHEKILGRCSLKALVCGFDFHYGYRGSGSSETLKEAGGFEVAVVDAVTEGGIKISSTRICELIGRGEIEEAEKLLGFPFEMAGKVIRGKGIGRQMGFPTANIQVPEEYILPRPGVYAGFVTVKGKQYKAMINLGHNPTINYTVILSLEAHLLDFSEDIYGERVIVRFVSFMREETRFMNQTNLIMQLELDEKNVRKILNGKN